MADDGTRCAECGMGYSEHEPMTPNDHLFTPPAPAAKPVAEPPDGIEVFSFGLTKPGAERCCPEHGLHYADCDASCPPLEPSPATRAHAAEGEWWQHFNDRVRGRVEGEYGPFTNADWQAACAAEREIAALRARVEELERVIEEAPHDWACHTQTAPVSGDCDCWKSEAKVSG